MGLNVDTVPFNPLGSCQSGGLYFTTAENLVKYLDYGNFIAEIKIPDDAEVYKDPEGDKWKADKIEILSVTKFIDHPFFCDHTWLLKALQFSGNIIQLIENPTEGMCLAAIRENGYSLQYIKNPSEELCLIAVRQNGNAIRFIKNPTEEMCLIAINYNPYVLKYIKNQTEKMCLAAVKQEGYVLEYVKNQTPEICKLAIKNKLGASKYINFKQSKTKWVGSNTEQ